MHTTMTIIFVNGGASEHPLPDLPLNPGLDRLRSLVMPHLPAAEYMERVACLHPDFGPVDMFVGSMSAADGLPVNKRATSIYRNNWLTAHRGDDPEGLPAIHGTAVLFSRRVWF